MSTTSTYKSHDAAKVAGWFSRRHQTRAALDAARASREAEKKASAERIALSIEKTRERKKKEEKEAKIKTQKV